MFLQDCRHIFTLTLADLRFEWILSLCMVFALGAVFAPLFILLGLQEGIIGNMLDKLRHDPVSRLVTPRFPSRTPLDADWLKSLDKQTELLIHSATSHLVLDIEGHDQRINAIPTIAQDPLLRENNINLPNRPDVIVLSTRLAKAIGKKLGDDIDLVLERNTGKKERIVQPFELVGILPETVTTELKIWLPQIIFHDIYQWRKGKALPSLGLSGKGGYLTPEYDGIVTVLEKSPSDEDYHRILAGKLSFSQAPKPLQKLGWTPPKNKKIYLWQPLNSQVYSSDISPLVNRHHELGYPVEAIPFIADFAVNLVSEEHNKELVLTVLPTSLQTEADKDQYELPQVWISPQEGYTSGEIASISFISGTTIQKKVDLPVVITAFSSVAPGNIALSPKLAGKMNAARRQTASYDSSTGGFIPEESANYFFRAYAKSIDEIESLVEFVREQGIKQGENALREPVSKLAQVYDLRKLSGYMEKLYLLIVFVSGVSGFFAIVANVYASVERKRRDLAYLQLLGIHRWALFLFPYLKSQALVVGGLMMAIVTYILFDFFSSMTFSHVLGNANSLTRLSWLHTVILMAAIFVTASLASLLAAAAVNRIEVGEIIHE